MVLSSVQKKPSDFVRASLTYSVDTGEKPISASVGPGGRLRQRIGVFEEHVVAIHDGRPMVGHFSLDREGFLLTDHETKVSDFYDEEEVRSVYYPEAERLVKELTGASHILIFDHTLRSGDETTQETKQVREPVKLVHNDYTEWSGPQRVRDLLPAEEAKVLLRRRFAIVQMWRPIQAPVQREPLAICDARSLALKDLIAAERRHPNRVGEIYHIAFNPNHRWFYFPNMQRNEALVFKTYDSEKVGRSRFCAHASFEDPTSPSDAPPRESIEVRALAFF